ncbi:MAG: hypothetical protein JWP69_359 [Flaviaesturariibacter sp.]|nr:hypothetical protein [Flaviaesturariibacter sp.]
MKPKQFGKAAMLTVVLLALFIGGWEWYWRSKGYETLFDDSDALWADKRAMVYDAPDKSTVFIGSSRIKFDLDIPTWEKITGDKAVQLAMVGSSPLPALYDLGNDEKFGGKLVIDVTEPLFFSNAPPFNKTPKENIEYYKKRTPTQRFSFEVNHFLESNFVFLNREYLSTNALLGKLPLTRRPGVFVFPDFPEPFDRSYFSRQSFMADEFVKDTNLQKQMQANWAMLGEAAKRMPPASAKDLETMFTSAKDAIDKIRSRGGQVLFVRTPSSGPMGEGEKMGFPRDRFWDKLLAVTKTEGVHFADYAETAHFICPEWSHLSPADAITYTKLLIRQLEQKGWVFPHKTATANQSSTSKL